MVVVGAVDDDDDGGEYGSNGGNEFITFNFEPSRLKLACCRLRGGAPVSRQLCHLPGAETVCGERENHCRMNLVFLCGNEA